MAAPPEGGSVGPSPRQTSAMVKGEDNDEKLHADARQNLFEAMEDEDGEIDADVELNRMLAKNKLEERLAQSGRGRGTGATALQTMGAKELRLLAAERGIPSDEIENAHDEDDAHGALVALLLAQEELKVGTEQSADLEHANGPMDESRSAEQAPTQGDVVVNVEAEELKVAGMDAKSFLEKFDQDHDGVVSQEEWAAGQADMDKYFANNMIVNIDKLSTALSKEEERQGACTAACVFMIFTMIYIAALDMQFSTESSYAMTKGLTYFVEGIDADGLTLEDVASGADVLDWINDGLIPEIFSDAKYNNDTKALWERNYLVSFNKVIGGVFLLQHRGARRDERKCTTRFSLFYPACYSEELSVLPYGPDYDSSKDTDFSELTVTKSALGGGTQKEVCEELATSGTFCEKCLEQLVGANRFETLKVYPLDGECGKCKEQCQLLVAPNQNPKQKLNPDDVCGMCTYADSVQNKFRWVGQHYLAGLTPPGGTAPVPDKTYGWDVSAPAAVELRMDGLGEWPPDAERLRAALASEMSVDISRVQYRTPADPQENPDANWAAHFPPMTSTTVRVDIMEADYDKPCTVGCNTIHGVVWPKDSDNAVASLDSKFVMAMAAAAATSPTFRLTDTDIRISGVVPIYSTCSDMKSSCLETVCGQCTESKNEADRQAKIEAPCSSLFSGGPLTDPITNKRYDCAVRLSRDGHGGNGDWKGRVEVRHSLLTPQWGTVCSSGWDDADATVFCRSIGFEYGEARTPAMNEVITPVQVCDTPEMRPFINASGHAVVHETQCYNCDLAPGAEYCSIKVIAHAGMQPTESSWQLDPAGGGPGGVFTYEYQVSETNFDLYGSPGDYTLSMSDTGSPSFWNPAWFELVDTHAYYMDSSMSWDWYYSGESCQNFWEYFLTSCRRCLADAGLSSSSTFSEYASSCPGECDVYEDFYSPREYGYYCDQLLESSLGANAMAGTVKIVKRECTDQADAATCTDTTEVLAWEQMSQWDGSSQNIHFSCGAGTIDDDSCAFGECQCATQNVVSYPPKFGAGTGPVWLANVDCTGTENSLCECNHTKSGVSGPLQWDAGHFDCQDDHASDAGVECFGTSIPPVPRTLERTPRIKDCDEVCVPKSRLNDGWCDTGEFNANFNCQQLQCDGDGTGTGDCAAATCEPAPVECPVGKWRCESGQCIDGSQRCDNVPQCSDKSDEQQCLGVFCCTDGTACIPLDWRNDDWPDCLDGSDETQDQFNSFHYNTNNPFCRAVMPMCDMYLQDKSLSCSDTIMPESGCNPQDWGNGNCNPLCGTAECAWDGGDCPPGLDMQKCEYEPELTDGVLVGYAQNGGKCSHISNALQCTLEPQCDWTSVTSNSSASGSINMCTDDPLGWFSNGRCDLKFNSTECGYDNGECLKCTWNDPARDCITSNLGDGFCDWDCHTQDCGWDGGDCPALIPSASTTAATTCPADATFLGNGVCDGFFNTESCGCDMGDCKDDTGFIGDRMFVCTQSNAKIFKSQLCDGTADCIKQDDEEECEQLPVCSNTKLKLTTTSWANEITFSIDGGFRYGDVTRTCDPETDTCPVSGCSDGNSHCTPFSNHNSGAVEIELHLTPGLHTIHAFDSASDGWGLGAKVDILQQRHGSNGNLQWQSVASTGEVTGGSKTVSFELTCAVSASPPVNQTVCAAGGANTSWLPSCTVKTGVQCEPPAVNSTVCANTNDCRFVPAPNGGAQGSCVLASASQCAAALWPDVNGTGCTDEKCTYSSTCYATNIVHSAKMFLCSDGTKIPFERVCDGVHDCPVNPSAAADEKEDEKCTFFCQDPPCAPGCSAEMQTDEFCNEACFTAACNYDNRACDQCSSRCFDWLRGDKTCNAECANAACAFDNGDCDSGVDTRPDPDWCANATTNETCTACDFASEASRVAAGCSLGITCKWQGGDCVGVSDLAWSQQFLVEATTSTQEVAANFGFAVSNTYADSIFGPNGQIVSQPAYITLQSSLATSIATALGVPTGDVDQQAIQIEQVVGIGRRLQAGSKDLSVTYVVECTNCNTATENAVTPAFAQAVLGAVIHSAAVCCPGANGAPATCGNCASADSFGAAAVISQVGDISLEAPVVQEKASDWLEFLECAPDDAAGVTPDADTDGCLFSMTMDGVCQCDCLASFTDPLCGLNDQQSGDCNQTQIGDCYGISVGAGDGGLCTIYDTAYFCAADTHCNWDDSERYCAWQFDEYWCNIDSGCEWNANSYMCEETPRCSAASACNGGETLLENSGSIDFLSTDPMFASEFLDSGEYRPNLQCRWNLQCPAGSCAQISFGTFETEAGYDYVTIHNMERTDFGWSPSDACYSAAACYEGGSGGWCSAGDQCWEANPMFAQTVSVEFASDGSVGSDGFTAQYSCIEGECAAAVTVDLSCPYTDNGYCDEPWNCPYGSDTNDCSGGDPYSDPYSSGGSGSGSGSGDPYSSGGDPYSSGGDPYSSGGDPYSSGGDPYSDPDSSGGSETCTSSDDCSSDAYFCNMDYEGGGCEMCEGCDPCDGCGLEAEGVLECQAVCEGSGSYEGRRRRLGTRCVGDGGTVPCRAISAVALTWPEGWGGSANAPPPPPPPPIKFVPQTAVASINTDITVNDTAPGLSVVLKGLKGFTPRCDSAEEDCPDEDKRFIYFVPISKEVDVDRKQTDFRADLVRQLWIDSQTRQVEARFIVYNGNVGLFAIVSVYFDFILGGEMQKEVQVTSLDLELLQGEDSTTMPDGSIKTSQYGDSDDSIRVALEFVVLFQVLWTAYEEIGDIVTAHRVTGSALNYFVSMWNFLDVTSIVLYSVCSFYWLYYLQLAESVKIGQGFDWSGEDSTNKLLHICGTINESAAALKFYLYCSIANVCVQLMRFFKYTRFQGRLNIVNGTFGVMAEDLFHFMIVFLIILLMFAIMGKLIMGAKDEVYSGWSKAMTELVVGSIGFGATDLEGSVANGGQLGQFYFFLFIFLVFVVLQNFFLAIVVDSYGVAKERADEANSIFQDAGTWLAAKRIALFKCCRCTKGTAVDEQDKQPKVIEIDEKGVPDMEYLLDERVLKVVKVLKYKHSETTVNADKLRDLIVAEYDQRGEAGLGRQVANSLTKWYFDHIDDVFNGIEEELNEVEDKVDHVMEMARENKASIEAVQKNIDDMRTQILDALQNIQLELAAK